MFVEEGQGGLLLANTDQLLGPFEDILGATVRRRRHDGYTGRCSRWDLVVMVQSTFAVFVVVVTSGLRDSICVWEI
jgi:hypothetical protein